MAKKLVAVTEIRHDDLVIAPGETLDTSKFDKKQLESLYDAGAVRVEGSDEAATTTSTEPKVSADQSAEASAAPTAKSTPAPAVKETPSAKSSGK